MLSFQKTSTLKAFKPALLLKSTVEARSEQQKCDWLVKEIESNRPLLPDDLESSDIVKEVIATYKPLGPD